MKIFCSYCNSCDKGKRMSIVDTRGATSVSSIWGAIMHEEPNKIQNKNKIRKKRPCVAFTALIKWNAFLAIKMIAYAHRQYSS